MNPRVNLAVNCARTKSGQPPELSIVFGSCWWFSLAWWFLVTSGGVPGPLVVTVGFVSLGIAGKCMRELRKRSLNLLMTFFINHCMGRSSELRKVGPSESNKSRSCCEAKQQHSFSQHCLPSKTHRIFVQTWLPNEKNTTAFDRNGEESKQCKHRA